MNIRGHDIGVCSWSLRAADTADLIAKVRELGLSHLQLAFGPLLAMDEGARNRDLDLIRNSGLTITAGMMGFADEDYSTIAQIHETGGFLPDALWPQRLELTLAAGRMARDLGVTLLTVHAGFIPPSNQAAYRVMLGRLRELAAGLAEFGVEITMETGQEHAAELLQFINDLTVKNVHVNFDPANMILYGAGDPIEAVRTLGRHIRHVHVKDATLSSQPGVSWGEEVPFGTGQVGPRALLAAFDEVGFTGPMAIEREAGDSRMEDVRFAIRTLHGLTDK
jgi:L-ribulose-5-phosphate 3-epimerase